MSLTAEPFGALPDGPPVIRYTLSRPGGLTLRVLTYGGIVQSLEVPDASGQVANVVAFAALIGDARPEMTVLDVSSIDGDRATVTYDYDRGEYGQSDQPWVLEPGGWRYDDC